MSVVLDASAILAIIFGERGAADVSRRAAGASLSAVNLFEALAKAKGLADLDQQTVAVDIRNLGVEIAPFDARQGKIAAALPAKVGRKSLAMADRACLALAIAHDLPVLTGDRLWLGFDIGVRIELFR